MRGSALWTLLAVGASVRPGAAAPLDERQAPAPAPLPTGATPFHVVSQEEALSSLSAKAEATPSAVHFLPGVPLAKGPDGRVHDITPGKAPSMTPPTAVKRVEDRAGSSCASPTTVQEWRNMSPTNQKAFTAAIKCLMNTSARSGLPGTKNRWDDLAAIHQKMTPQIHMEGQFLPWHRYFLYIFEQELRNTCRYTGPMAWWDETKDAGRFYAAPMYTSSYFGSMPDGNSQCIRNGQFSGITLHIGPGSGNSNHCLARGCNEQTSAQITAGYVNQCWSYQDFNDMQKCIDYGVHALGHNAIGGGVMNDVYASPQDPAFFLHHGFVNRIWSYWQHMSPSNRTNFVDGYTTSACEQGSQTSGCQTVTTSYVLTSQNFYPSVTVGQVMDTAGGFLCYQYDY